MDGTTWKAIAAIGAIALVEVVALCKGKNGFMLRLTIAAIALLAGVGLAELIGR